MPVENSEQLFGPNPEDVRKLHNEINQIVNQRFTLTTLTVTVFGLMIAWLTPKGQPPLNNGKEVITYMGAVLIIIVIFVLFLLTWYLGNMLRVFTTYLNVSDASGWEKDWSLYRRKYSYDGYTKFQSWMFLVFGFIAMVYPFFIGITIGPRLKITWYSIVCVLVGFVYMETIRCMGINGMYSKEKAFENNWKSLRKPLVSTCSNTICQTIGIFGCVSLFCMGVKSWFINEMDTHNK